MGVSQSSAEARINRFNLQVHQSDTGKCLANNIKEGDALVVVAIAAISFVLVHSDDVSIQHILGDVALIPA